MLISPALKTVINAAHVDVAVAVTAAAAAAAALICALNDVIIFILTTLGSGRDSDAVKYDDECEYFNGACCVLYVRCAALLRSRRRR